MFRFTIRDVLWLTVVVAMGVGWWVDRNAVIKCERDSKAREFSALDDQWRLERTELENLLDRAVRYLAEHGAGIDGWPPD